MRDAEPRPRARQPRNSRRREGDNRQGRRDRGAPLRIDNQRAQGSGTCRLQGAQRAVRRVLRRRKRSPGQGGDAPRNGTLRRTRLHNSGPLRRQLAARRRLHPQGTLCRRARAQGHLLRKRMEADRARPRTERDDRLPLPCLPHIVQGKRGADTPRQGQGRQGELRDGSALSCPVRRRPAGGRTLQDEPSPAFRRRQAGADRRTA